MMKLLIAGGGTGGHVFPALAVAESFLKKTNQDKSSILFVGTKKGIESKLIPQRGFNIKFIKTRGIKRTNIINKLKAFYELPLAILTSIKLIKNFDPAFVVGVGGYASGPVLFAAKLLKKPTAIMEQNSIPGITNRILSRFVDKVFTSYELNTTYFPINKISCVGNPISEEFLYEIKQKTPKNDKTTLLVLGGSQGARIINYTFLKALDLFEFPKEQIHIIHQTGIYDFENIIKLYKNVKYSHNVKPFFDNMPALYNEADIVISRAGAMTISELQIAAKASILIPFAAAADNHQELNAKEMLEKKAALMIRESDFTPGFLTSKIINLYEDPKLRNNMEIQAKSLSKPKASTEIIEALFNMKR